MSHRATALAAELLADLAVALEGRRVPRVRALHLPPSPWNGSKDGEFGALELDDGSLGLSYVLLDGGLASAAGGGASAIVGAEALDVARGWADAADGARRTLGFAAVNALTRHLFDLAGYQPPPAADSVGGLDPQPDEAIGMVGYFPPLVKQVTACGARLTVIELREELAGEHDDHRVTLDVAALASCDKVLCTSTVLLNDTLDTVLAQCRGARALAMIGPGASCLPDALFARGVTAMGGTWIADGPAFAAALQAGAPWGRWARKTLVGRDAYPGVAALRARLRA